MNGSKIILITGPARSGKSEWAEKLAQEQNQPIIYIATALLTQDDLEWQQRIELHQQRRPRTWQTWEVPFDLPEAISQANPPHCLLIDSVGTWIANLIEQDNLTWEQTQTRLLDNLEQTPLKIILVAEETGWGVIPAYPMGRKFRDRLGTLVRHLGAIASIVYLVTGGYVLNLSELGTPLSKGRFPR